VTVEPIVPVIDYTSRDYEAIRADMIRLIRQRLPEWAAENPNDFGVALVEAYAYAVDQLHYYLDRVSNEAYLGTAVQRESVMALAAMFGYTPYDAVPSRVYLFFGNSTGTDVTIPAGARVQATLSTADNTVVRTFETTADVVVGANTVLEVSSAVASVVAQEGRTYRNEHVGVSGGTAYQRFVLPRTNVLLSTVEIATLLNDDVMPWVKVDRLEDASNDDRAFILERQSDGSTAVIFGDSYNGEIPPLHANVLATYRVGGSNVVVPANSLTELVEPRLPGITVTNPAPSGGGRDAEGLDSVRVNAAQAYRSVTNRAVTLEDFVSLAKTYPGVNKAKAVTDSGTSVTVFVAMAAGSPEELSYEELLPYSTYQKLFQNNTTYQVMTYKFPDQISLTSAEARRIQDYLQNLTMAGVTVTVLGPAWLQMFVDLTIHCLPSARQADVVDRVRRILDEYFGFANVNFDDKISVYTITTALAKVPGLAYATVNGIGTDGSPMSLRDLDFASVGVNAVPWWEDDPASPEPSLRLTVVGGRP
jgi:hypothetical protein